MEQNKVLMIIVSVAIFFAAIVGVGVALLYPRADADTETARTETAGEFDPIEYVRRPDTAPLDDQNGEEEPVIIVYGEREETDEDAAAEEGASDRPAVEGSRNDTSSRTISVPAEESPGDEVAEAEERDDTATPPAEDAAATERSAPAPAEAETDRGTIAETRPEPRRIRVTEYWIQLIASPNRDRVEQVRGMLADYSLGGRVTTRDVDGQLYYRLRVGPYENRDEAEKFLTWIREIEGFENAYISEEYPLRTVNG